MYPVGRAACNRLVRNAVLVAALTGCTTSPDVNVARATLPPPTQLGSAASELSEETEVSGASPGTSGGSPATVADSSGDGSPTTSATISSETTAPGSSSTGTVFDDDESTVDSVGRTSTNQTTTAGPTSTVEPQQAGYVGALRIEVVAEYPHDDNAYTQGLEVIDGRLFESTGLYGESTRRWVSPTTGAVQLAVPLSGDLFGEGATYANGLIYQLTWKAGRLIVSDPADLAPLSTINFQGEGWGLCFDGQQFVMSNGSSLLQFRHPDTFAVTHTVDVTLNANPVDDLNELECVENQIVANVYGLDQIVVIDASTGNVDAVVDASSLRPDGLPLHDLDFALNGVARIPGTDRFYVTGKLWPVLYEVRFVDA